MNAAHAPIFDFLVHIMLVRRSKTLIFLYFQKLRCLTSAFDRPAFKEMMQDVMDGTINCIIVKDLSRLGREYIETGRYLRRVFPSYGVRLIAITDGIDTAHDACADDLAVSVKNIMNEAYARDISRDTPAR